MLLFTFGLPIAQTYAELGDRFHEYVRRWIHGSSTLLGISDYMLPNDADEPAAGEAATRPDTNYHLPRLFRVRIGVLLLFGWFTIFCIVTYSLSVPVWCGRAIFARLAPQAHVHDFYSFVVGMSLQSLLVTALSADARILLARLRDSVGLDGLRALGRHVIAMVRAVFFLGVGVGLFPLAVGLLVDLAIVTPMTCPLNMTPATTLWQDWGLGIMLCKALYELDIEGGPQSVIWFRDQVRFHLEAPTATVTISATTFLFGPLLVTLGMLLTVPYLIGYSPLLRAMWGARAAVEVYRLLYPLGLTFLVARFVRSRMLEAVDSIYQVSVLQRRWCACVCVWRVWCILWLILGEMSGAYL
jgi:hypothetical protein